MEATAFVEDFQKKLQPDKTNETEKKTALEEMKEDVHKLTNMARMIKGDVEFVKEVYKTWPPKASGAKLDVSLVPKKLLFKAITHYHPDKVDKDAHGKNWFYFCEEITKHLNTRYEEYKLERDQ